MSAQVNGNDLIVAREVRNLVRPITGTGPETMDQQQRLPGSCALIIQRYVTDMQIRHE